MAFEVNKPPPYQAWVDKCCPVLEKFSLQTAVRVGMARQRSKPAHLLPLNTSRLALPIVI